MKNRILFLIIVVTGLLFKESAGDIIYEQAGGVQQGLEQFNWYNNFLATDFNISGDWILESFTFTALVNDINTMPITDVYLNIYGNNMNEIGGQFYELGDLIYSEHITSSYNGVEIYYEDKWTIYKDYTVNIPEFFINEGSYWLGVHIAPLQNWNVKWLQTGPQIGEGTYISYNNGESYCLRNNYETIFHLDGRSVSSVPEPSTILLLFSGIFSLGYFKYRR